MAMADTLQKEQKSRAFYKFRSYLRDRDLTQKEVADSVGVREEMLCRHLVGKNLPSLESAFKYWRFTRGLVLMEDWLYIGNEDEDVV